MGLSDCVEGRGRLVVVPMLTIQPFVEAGVFRESVVGSAPGRVWRLNFPGAEGQVRHGASSDYLQFDFDNLRRSILVRIGWVRLTYGRRRYFWCSWCSEFRNSIVLFEQELMCPDCYLNLHKGGQKRRAGELFCAEALLNSENRELEWDSRTLVEALPAKYRAQAAPAVPPRQTWKRHDMMTETAIDRGQGLAYHSIYEEVADWTSTDWANIPTARGYVCPTAPVLITDHPILDIRPLTRRGQWRADRLTGQQLRWGIGYPFQYEAALFVDTRRAEPMMVVAHQSYEDMDRGWQRLPIIRQTYGRLRFLCPVLETACDMLFERNGLFASREAQRLVHPSQRAGGRGE